MKTKKLIKLLQEIDPTGEEEVSVNNEDIFIVQDMPAYYDGRLQVLIRDKSKEPYYDVIGCKVVAKGRKIEIRTMGWREVINNDPAARITYDTCFDSRDIRKEVRAARKEMISIIRKVNGFHPCVTCGFKKPKYKSTKGAPGLTASITPYVVCRCGKQTKPYNNRAGARDEWNKMNPRKEGGLK